MKFEVHRHQRVRNAQTQLETCPDPADAAQPESMDNKQPSQKLAAITFRTLPCVSGAARRLEELQPSVSIPQ